MFDPAIMPSRLEKFLRRRHPKARRIRVFEYQAMTGGYSRLMAHFKAEIDGDLQHLVARGDPPAGQSLMDTDRESEWLLLSALSEDGRVPLPRARFYDQDGSELGTKTIVSDFVEGSSFLSKLREADESQRPFLLDALSELAYSIHSADLSILPSFIERPASWDDYIEDRIDAWRRLEGEHSESLPVLRYISTWLDRNRPPSAPLSFVHGEFQASNIIAAAEGRLIAADWELGHIGDPREDLGYFRQVATVQPPDAIGWDVEGFCRRYRERSGLGEEVINPATLAYFTILPVGAGLQYTLAPVRKVAAGAMTSTVVVYNFGVLQVWSQQWLRQMPLIEAQLRVGRKS